MLTRDIEPELQDSVKHYPIVTVTGPRQSGKTTLVKHLFPKKTYYNLERPDIRALILNDPIGVLEQQTHGAIFDEVQRAPELLSYLQAHVDEQNKNGQYILTGSHQTELHAAVSQSLAGRTAILQLLPLSMKEMQIAQLTQPVNEYLLKGFLPKIYHAQLDPTKYYRNYIETYIEKDVRSLINIKDLLTFQKFLKLCAGRVGHVLNMNGLGNELGISHHTVKHWLSVLQATFVVTLLPPYFENFGKRIIKSPKLYFFDVGLASYLLDIETSAQLSRDPARGNLFENLIVMELYKTRYHLGKNPNLYYYRDSQQCEVDVVYKQAHKLIPIEIKAAKTMNKIFFRNLKYFKNLVQDRCPKGYLVYTGDHVEYGQFSAVNFENVSHIIE